MGILSVRGALPDHRYPQQEITDAFAAVIATAGGLDERLLRRFHANAGVEQRHLVLPLDEYGGLGGLRAGQRPVHRARRRARLAGAGRRAQGGRPDADRRRPGHLGDRDRARRAVARRADRRPDRAAPRREADAAGGAGLRRRRGRDRPAARLPGRPSGRRRGAGGRRAVLADRAARRRLHAQPGGERALRRRRRRGRGRRPGPRRRPSAEVVGTRSRLYPDSERTMGFDVTGGGLRIVLDAEVPRMVERYLARRRRRVPRRPRADPRRHRRGGSATPGAPR